MIDGVEFTAPHPKRDDPKYSYGIIPEQPKPEDVLYRLSYDADKSFLLLNRFVVQTFNWESNADKALGELFKKEGTVKAIDVHHPANAVVIVNNIKMPLALRSAFFRTGSDGHRLQLTIEVNRERAKKFNINVVEVEDYINKCRDKHYELLKTSKRK